MKTKLRSRALRAALACAFTLLVTGVALAQSPLQGAASPTVLSSGVAAPSAALVREFPIPAFETARPSPGPLSIADGPNRSFWIAEYSGGAIAEFFPSNGTFHQFIVPANGSLPAYITLDSHGMVWFSDQSAGGKIWMFDPSTKVFTPHPTLCQPSIPVGVLADAKNNIWFAEDSCNRLGELIYPSYTQEEYPLPEGGSGPAELAVRGTSVWITESLGNRVAMFNATTRSFREFVPSVPFQSPVGIVIDARGDVWVSEHGGSSIVELDPTKGTFRMYPTSLPPPSYGYANSAPATLAMDGQGRLWFVEHFSNKVGRLDPQTGRLDEFTIPSSGVYSIQSAIDPGGNFWFTEFTGNNIGMVPASASVRVQVKLSQAQGNSVQAGQSISVEFLVTNELTSKVNLTLSVTSTLTGSGYAPASEATLDTTYLSLDPGETAPVVAFVTPVGGTPPGNYSIGVSASLGNESEVGSATFLVVPNFVDLFLSQTFPDVLTVAIVGLLIGNFLVWGEIRKRDQRRSEKQSTLVLGLLCLASLVNVMVLPAYAKCPGLPGLGSSSSGPSYLTVVVLVVQLFATAVLAYFLVVGWLRLRQTNLTTATGSGESGEA